MENCLSIDNKSLNYNNEPVVYCKHCLSLKIMILDNDMDYCDNCGCTDTDTTDITSWEEMYKKKYGEYLIKNNKYGRE